MAADCKSAGFSLRWFKSNPVHHPLPSALFRIDNENAPRAFGWLHRRSDRGALIGERLFMRGNALFEPGRNCATVALKPRNAVVTGAADYFRPARDARLWAEEQILLIW